MAVNRLAFIVEKGQAQTFQIEMAVASGAAASIVAGTPTKMATAKAAAMVDGDGTTSQVFTGIAKGTSTDTASVAGIVQLWAPIPGIVYRGIAKSALAADTQSEIDALVQKRVVFDLTGNVWSVDTAASDATTNGVLIVGGNPRTSEIRFCVSTNITAFGNPTT